MDALIRLAEAWWPLYAVHFVEVSLFILVIWTVDRWMTLDTRLRYVLYLLALVKVFVPPFYAIPLPEFLTVSDDVPIGPVYVDMVSGDEVVASAQAIPLSLAFYLFCLWTISVLVWAGVTLWKNAAFHRALSLAMPVDLAREVGLLNGTRDMKVYAKASLRSPLLVGIVKPRLYLPARWSSWSPEELRGVVAHELAHRDNRDIWVLIFQAIAMALFCVNPLIWLLNRRLTFLRELRCDEAVLRETNLTPAEYGRLLFGFVDRRPALSALYFNERGTALKKRLEYILNFKEDNVKRSKWQLAIPILIGLAIVPFSIREAYTQSPPDADSSDVMQIDQVDTEPVLIHDVPPVYPYIARKAGLTGKVFLKFMVNVDGSVSDVSVLKGKAIFQKAAIDAISQFRFKPAEHNGKVVAVWITQPIGFSLGSTDTDLQLTSPVPIDADGNEVEFPEFFEVEAKPELLQSVKSVYPPRVTVRLELKVNVDGSVSDVKVLKGPEEFHQAAIDAISQYRFKPGTLNGKVVPVRMPQSIIFRLPKQQSTPPASGDADSSKVLEFFMVEVKPKVLHSVKFVHPEEAIRDSLEGKVFLKFRVNVDGSVSDVKVLKGKEIFHKAAIDAISQYRFKPAEHNGKVVPIWMTQPITFQLLNDKFDVKEIVDKVNVQEVVKKTDKYVLRIGRRVDVLAYDEVEVKPHPIDIVTPVYPEEAKKKKIEGKVTLKVVVDVDGSVSDVSVLKGPEIFRQASIDAALQFRFKPAEHKGKVVPVWMVMPIEFSLGSTDTDLQLTSPVPIDADGNEVEVSKFFEVEAKPELLQSVKFVYPPRVTVRLELKVNVDGSVSDVKVLKGPEEFHQAAIDAISQYRFKPGTLNGKVVPVRMQPSIIFRLPKQQTTPPASGDADSSKVLEFYMVEVKPKVLHSVKPVHPEEAIRDSLEGKVFLKFRVNVDGSVSDVKVLRGKEIFHKAAIDAISQYRFKPAEHNGKVVPVWMTQPLSFRLPKQQSTPPASGDADSSKVLEFFMVEVRPKLMHAVEPIPHPEEALRDSLEGKVFVKFIVNVDGSVSDVRVLRGLGVFHQAAIDAISQFRYIPAEHNGKPVAVWMTQPINFQLPKE